MCARPPRPTSCLFDRVATCNCSSMYRRACSPVSRMPEQPMDSRGHALISLLVFSVPSNVSAGSWSTLIDYEEKREENPAKYSPTLIDTTAAHTPITPFTPDNCKGFNTFIASHGETLTLCSHLDLIISKSFVFVASPPNNTRPSSSASSSSPSRKCQRLFLNQR